VARRRRARARLLRHRRAHLPVPFAADDPRSAALVLRVPAPQDRYKLADLARYNGNAEVKAFFASGQVRPIRVHSEGNQRSSEGTQRARGGHQGHSVAIRGLSEASQRHAERPSEAIRGHSEALTGHQGALRGHPWPSFAISSTQAHSVAIKRAPGPKTATMAALRAECAPCACACVRVFAALAGAARCSACCSSRCEPRRLRPCHTTFPAISSRTCQAMGRRPRSACCWVAPLCATRLRGDAGCARGDRSLWAQRFPR
jgi:hypothetical protein